MFIKILTFDDKCSLLNMDNLPQPVQRQLYKKQNFSSQFLSAFLKFTWGFKHFQKNDDPHNLCISKIRNYKIRGYLNV